MNQDDAIEFLLELGREGKEFVDKYQSMDLETEDLLFSGKSLRNGMIVVVGDSDCRRDLDTTNTPPQIRDSTNRAIDINNRWCLVTELELKEDRMGFIAIYSDGQKVRRNYDYDCSWVVKEISIPEMPKTMNIIDVQDEHTREVSPEGVMTYQFTTLDGEPLFVVTHPEEELKRHDPAWAIKNLKRQCTSILKDMFDSGKEWRCVKTRGHMETEHRDERGSTWVD